MADHNPQHGRRPHFNRGRRGPDRRGGERRTPPPHAAEPGGREASRDGVDVEQIMREIRSRIAQRHGIELNTQQIQELAARRLEAILEPRNIKPSLLEQLRKSAGSAPDLPAAPAVETYSFEETTLYDTHRGILRFFRRLLNPILKLFFNPGPLIHALNTQTRINQEAAAREAERERRQSEWNALHYELVQRVVTEMSRISIEMQSLSMKVESLAAKVDFNERRVRSLENAPAPARQQPRYQEPRSQESRVQEPRFQEPAAAAASPLPENTAPGETAVAESTPGEGTRRRRRRRRGRRSGGGVNDAAMATETPGTADVEEAEGPEGADLEVEDDEPIVPAEEREPEQAPAAEFAAATAFPEPQEPPAMPVIQPPVSTLPEPAEPPSHTAAVPSPPRDEPAPADPVDHADPGPVDR